MSISDNLARVRERLELAAGRCGRDPNSIALMAVCKTQPVSAVRDAYAAGQRLFGENRVQEFAQKSPELAALPDAKFHLIGHLQSNKANKATELFSSVDSVDSLNLAERLNAAASALNKRLRVLIEINIGGEEAKAGLRPDIAEVLPLFEAAPQLASLDIAGLMTVPPFTEDPEGARPHFRRLRELRDELSKRGVPQQNLRELSMGMSHDFEVAIEEGSTCVRVGTAIFGERKKG